MLSSDGLSVEIGIALWGSFILERVCLGPIDQGVVYFLLFLVGSFYITWSSGLIKFPEVEDE
jgi:hypothetical protein